VIEVCTEQMFFSCIFRFCYLKENRMKLLLTSGEASVNYIPEIFQESSLMENHTFFFNLSVNTYVLVLLYGKENITHFIMCKSHCITNKFDRRMKVIWTPITSKNFILSFLKSSVFKHILQTWCPVNRPTAYNNSTQENSKLT